MIAVALVFALSALMLVVWAMHYAAPTLWLFGLPATPPAVAALFAQSAMSLWMLARAHTDSPQSNAVRRRIARGAAGSIVVAAVVMLLSRLPMIQSGSGWLQGLAALALLMPPNVAKNFILLATGLLLVDVTTRRGRRPGEYFAVAVLLIALLALLGHAYGIREVVQGRQFMPIPVALSFFLLALGLLCARPATGLMNIVTGDGPGGAMARTLLPGTALLLLVLGWLRLQGERHGLYAADLGVTLYTFAFMTIFGALIWWTARSLHVMEAQRAASEAERKRFYAVSPDLLYIAGFDGFLKNMNPAWETLLGYKQAELMANPYLDLVHPDDRAATLEALQGIEDATHQLSYENRLRCADGGYRWFSWRATAVPEQALIYGSARDITDRRKADNEIRSLNVELADNARKLEQSNRELEAFSYTISHDLRAPLRHIDGYARMLQEDGAEQLSPELLRYIDVISDSARHMGTLIDDLLAFSRLGRKTLETTRIDTAELIDRALHEASGGQPLAAQVSVQQLPAAYADPVLFRQVWVNLLSNALKYTAPRGGSAAIEITGEQDGGVTRYRIRDNGVGFDMRYADKLFGVFQRLHSNDEFDGTGVGLAIVHRALQRHGGSITAHAEPGKGATFTIEIPAEETAA
jgi:PAS domain S-box-containing protein